MPTRRRRVVAPSSSGTGPNVAVLAIATIVVVLAASCGDAARPAESSRGDCPVERVEVVVSVDQWGDVVDRLGGDCATVTTIVTSASGDPHEFEPTPGDIARFAAADLVVVNGLGYDSWARQALDAVDATPPVIDAGEIAGRRDGDNPHVWYSPSTVRGVADAVTAQLERLAPGARAELADRHAAWERSLEPYDAEIARIRATAGGRTYAATEPVFDDMAAALGLRDVTPSGYRRAAGNESEPAPGDVAAFDRVLRDRSADVLVFNTQTEAAVPDQLRSVAEASDVGVVEVTETLPAGARSFVDWQVAQLRALARAIAS